MVMTPGTSAPISGPGAYPMQPTQFYPSTTPVPQQQQQIMPMPPGMPMQPGMMMVPQPGMMMVPGGAIVSPLVPGMMMMPGGSGGALGPTGAPDFLSALGMYLLCYIGIERKPSMYLYFKFLMPIFNRSSSLFSIS